LRRLGWAIFKERFRLWRLTAEAQERQRQKVARLGDLAAAASDVRVQHNNAAAASAIHRRLHKKLSKSVAAEGAKVAAFEHQVTILDACAMLETERAGDGSPFNLRIMRKSAVESGGLVFLSNNLAIAAALHDEMLTAFLNPERFNSYGDGLARACRHGTCLRVCQGLRSAFEEGIRASAAARSVALPALPAADFTKLVVKTVDPLLSRVTNVRLAWYCTEVCIKDVRIGLVLAAERKATHSDKLNFLLKGSAGQDDPINCIS